MQKAHLLSSNQMYLHGVPLLTGYLDSSGWSLSAFIINFVSGRS
jgi:hypothetical protein